MEALARFSGGVAHELNNQLTGVLGFASVLARQLGQHPASPLLAELRNAAEHAAALSRQMQAFGHQPTVRQRPVDLLTATRGAVDGVRQQIAAGVTVSGPDGSADVLALADPTLLTQGLMGLLPQTALCAAQGGTLTVQVNPGAAPSVRCVVHPAQITAAVFIARCMPFTEPKSVHGHGLPLAAAWRALHLAGGHVDAHDEATGLVVTVTFSAPN